MNASSTRDLTAKQIEALRLFASAQEQILFYERPLGATRAYWAPWNADREPNDTYLLDVWDEIPPGGTSFPIENTDHETVMYLFKEGLVQSVHGSVLPWTEPMKLSSKGKVALMQRGIKVKSKTR